MHELGHNLNLRHGGFEGSNGANDPQNLKPNYRSIMSYLYSDQGIDVDGNGELDDFAAAHEQRINYSSQEVILNEEHLNETTGITGVGPAIDFNCDGSSTGTNVEKDLQCRDWAPQNQCLCGGSTGTIKGYDDWSNIELFKSPPGMGGGGTVIEEVTCYGE
jgi:hypothetical protein